MIGPILGREYLVAPRRAKFYMQRVVFVAALFSLVGTVWLLLAGMQQVRNCGDLARFGALAFQLVVPLELLVVMFLSAVSTAAAVAQEKDRRTLVLLLLTRLGSSQIVLGKLLASLLTVANMVLASLPLLLALPLLGGVSTKQALLAMLVILVSSLWCGALGALVGFWREKTFQALAITLLAIAAWCVLGEAITAGQIPGIDSHWGKLLSPLRASWSVCQALPDPELVWLPGGAAVGYSLLAGLATILLCGISIVRLRVWNPSQQLRQHAPEFEDSTDLAAHPAQSLAAAASWKVRAPRHVWSNPVLWREMCTWAYGRKLMFLRIVYVVLFAVAMVGLYWSVQSGVALQRSRLTDELIPMATKILAPFLVISLIMINALAVNSITNERDGQALDLLLVTQITPAQFLIGKLAGVLYVTKEMVVLPLALCTYLWWQGGLATESLCYVLLGLVTMILFVTMLGIHCGMIHAQSRGAIATSLGTVFFLFLGVVMCMLVMLSFRGSFASQLPPFLVIILGGGLGLFSALGVRNPSPAIALASFGLPFLTFFAITSFILRNQELSVFSVIVVGYGFATAAMVIPALSEFDFAMERSRVAAEEE